MFRRFLVWPAALIWPANFSMTTLLYALHDQRKMDPAKTNGWQISGYRYFGYLAIASFAWYWFPGVLWQGLSVFSFVTWIKPNNAVLNQLFGGFTGLSLIPLTFDWTYVTAYLQDPLLSPTFSHLNTLVGLGIFMIITTIGISYTGALYAAYLPINTSTTFDNTQSEYDVTKIMGPNFSFDLEKYKAYSPLFLAPTFALNYGLSFASLTASLVHTIVFHGKEVLYRFKTARNQEADVHMRLMKKYKDAPDWWYLVLFVISVCLGLATVLAYPSQLPWWAYFVSIILALVFVIPCCMILGITNIQLSLNVISPFLAGFMIPGKPVGVMIFVSAAIPSRQQDANAVSESLQHNRSWSSADVYCGPEARSLHEGQRVSHRIEINILIHCLTGPTTSHHRLPSRSHHLGRLRTNCRHELDSRQHRRRLLLRPSQPLHLPKRSYFL